MSPYEVLRVGRDATPDELKRAYRARVRETHPDCGGDAESFARVQAAASVLLDPDRRATYDRYGCDWTSPRAVESVDLLTIIVRATESATGRTLEELAREVRDGLTPEARRVLDVFERATGTRLDEIASRLREGR